MNVPAQPSPETGPNHPPHVFRHVVCGVNGTPESIEAVRQATRIAEPTASVSLIFGLNVSQAARAAPDGQELTPAARLRRAAERALEEAREAVQSRGIVEAKVIEATPAQAVIGSALASADCLLSIGSHGRLRPHGALLGSLATRAVHSAPCSVLIARAPVDPRAPFPDVIVVGLDGSEESRVAFAVARRLHERLGARLRPLTALGGMGVDLEGVQKTVGEFELKIHKGHPADALAAASVQADLLVVGYRGLHSLRYLGTVAEQVSHLAKSSVLVVREAGWL